MDHDDIDIVLPLIPSSALAAEMRRRLDACREIATRADLERQVMPDADRVLQSFDIRPDHVADGDPLPFIPRLNRVRAHIGTLQKRIDDLAAEASRLKSDMAEADDMIFGTKDSCNRYQHTAVRTHLGRLQRLGELVDLASWTKKDKDAALEHRQIIAAEDPNDVGREALKQLDATMTVAIRVGQKIADEAVAASLERLQNLEANERSAMRQRLLDDGAFAFGMTLNIDENWMLDVNSAHELILKQKTGGIEVFIRSESDGIWSLRVVDGGEVLISTATNSDSDKD